MKKTVDSQKASHWSLNWTVQLNIRERIEHVLLVRGPIAFNYQLEISSNYNCKVAQKLQRNPACLRKSTYLTFSSFIPQILHGSGTFVMTEKPQLIYSID